MDVGCCCVCVTTVPPMRNPICFGERAYGRSVLRSNQKTQLRPWAALAGMSQLGCLGSNLGMEDEITTYLGTANLRCMPT